MESRRKRSRSQLLKWGCYVLALFVCAALQTTPGLFQLGQAKPLLVLPLCLAVAVFEGEFAGALLGELPQSQSFQPQHGGVGGLSVIRATQHHGQGDVFDGRQFRQQLSGLEDETEGAAAQFGAVSVAQPRQVGTAKHHIAGCRGDDAGECVQ